MEITLNIKHNLSQAEPLIKAVQQKEAELQEAIDALAAFKFSIDVDRPAPDQQRPEEHP